MRIVGRWYEFDDGVVRPVVLAEIPSPDGSSLDVLFVVDTGADRTVLTSSFYSQLIPDDTGETTGLNETDGFSTAVIETQVQFVTAARQRLSFRGSISVSSDPDRVSLCTLGRDLLNNFAVVVDRPRNVVALLTADHPYSIQEP